MKFIRYDMIDAYYSGEKRHPQKVMKELGITYQIAVPQSISDSWHFWNCKDIPESLPEFVVLNERDPNQYVGRGLSKQDVVDLLASGAH